MSDDVLLHSQTGAGTPPSSPPQILISLIISKYLRNSGTAPQLSLSPCLTQPCRIVLQCPRHQPNILGRRDHQHHTRTNLLADWKICNLKEGSPGGSFASLLLAEIDNERYFSCSLYYCPWTDLEAKKVWTESCTWRQPGQAVWSLHHMSILDSDQPDPIYRPCLAQLQHQPPPDQPRPQQHRVKLLKGKKS